jgi:phosphohistidine phosphatase
MSERTLVILRHAKAERPAESADVDRPLTERGHADAGAAGAWLAAHGYHPDLVLCSPARRTRQTWHGIAVALTPNGATEVRYEPSVYEAGPSGLLTLIQAIEPRFHTVLLIGHNPTMSLLSAMLDPTAPRDSDGLRTSGLTVHSGPAQWADFAPAGAPVVAAHTGRA